MAQRFGIQYNRLIDAAQDYAADETLQERIVAGAGYFKDEWRFVSRIDRATRSCHG